MGDWPNCGCAEVDCDCAKARRIDVAVAAEVERRRVAALEVVATAAREYVAARKARDKVPVGAPLSVRGCVAWVEKEAFDALERACRS